MLHIRQAKSQSSVRRIVLKGSSPLSEQVWRHVLIMCCLTCKPMQQDVMPYIAKLVARARLAMTQHHMHESVAHSLIGSAP